MSYMWPLEFAPNADGNQQADLTTPAELDAFMTAKYLVIDVQAGANINALRIRIAHSGKTAPAELTTPTIARTPKATHLAYPLPTAEDSGGAPSDKNPHRDGTPAEPPTAHTNPTATTVRIVIEADGNARALGDFRAYLTELGMG